MSTSVCPLSKEFEMTDLRKAVEMALEALESLDCGDTYKTHNAASALRQALAQPDEVLAEREACAALCSATAAGRDAEAIEEAIRARGEK
jgi:hypothetical protein